MTTAKTVTLIISVLTLLVGQQISAGTVKQPTEQQSQAQGRFPQTALTAERHRLTYATAAFL